MDKQAIIKYCKGLGCCDACCVRYLGYRNPGAYENTHEFIKKLLEPELDDIIDPKSVETTITDVTVSTPTNINTEHCENKDSSENAGQIEKNADTNIKLDENVGDNETTITNNCRSDINTTEDVVKVEKNANNGSQCKSVDSDDDGGTPAKRAKTTDVCYSCIGVLEERSWEHAVQLARKEMESKGYSCNTFACALSAPISIAFREKVVTLRLRKQFPQWSVPLTPLKEAWKWSFGSILATSLGMTLESGAVAPLLVQFNMEYTHDLDELRVLSSHTNTRRIVNRRELDSCLSSLHEVTFPVDPPREGVHCTAVVATHEPAYIGGRYIKLSRCLPQTPWVVHGERMMPSSVQEVIFKPIAELYGVPAEEIDRRMKLVSAGREDVDVRCLGEGRPFAVEILDPRFKASEEQLRELCLKISEHEYVKVRVMKNISKHELSELKKGEESKLKTYHALCIKLQQTDEQLYEDIRVSPADIALINSLGGGEGGLLVNQRTPLRVLHRRPLHTRRRHIYEIRAASVPDHPRLLTLVLVAEAGTYIKEWVHGELSRTSPSLRDSFPVDILALDVAAVQLDWPPNT